MQGLYKKVLRGIYPKIPNIFSNDLAQTIKYLVQVAPQMRPSCEKILEMPIVRKKIEKLMPGATAYQQVVAAPAIGQARQKATTRILVAEKQKVEVRVTSANELKK